MDQSTSAGMTTTILNTFQRMMTGPHAVAAVAGLALVITAGIIAPGDSPGTWTWVRLLVGATSAGLALTVIDALRDPAENVARRGPHLLIAGVLLLLTIVISATFGSLALLFGLLVLALVLLHMNARGPSSLPVLWALLVMLVPFWVWSAFEAWDRLLLLLIPLGVVGIVSLEHALRADLYGESTKEQHASWIGILGMAAILLIIAMAESPDTKWVATGAIVSVALAALDLVPARSRLSNLLPAITLPGTGLLVLMLTWLAAL